MTKKTQKKKDEQDIKVTDNLSFPKISNPLSYRDDMFDDNLTRQNESIFDGCTLYNLSKIKGPKDLERFKIMSRKGI